MCYDDYDCTVDIIWSVVSLILLLFIITALLRLCIGRRRRARGNVIHPAPVVVTSTTTQAMPVPQSNYYPTQAVTPAVISQSTVHYPMPQPQPYSATQNTIQPPYPVGVHGMPQPQDFNQQPPSYDQVQSHQSMYMKQPPYNPNFSGQ